MFNEKIQALTKLIANEEKIKEYRSIPFWSWNDKLDCEKLTKQICWFKENGFGGYFMHARGGLTTEYLGDEWFNAIDACVDKGEELGLESWAYDENGWPSGFVGGKLLEDLENRDRLLKFEIGEFDSKSFVSYKILDDEIVRTNKKEDGFEYLNVYLEVSNSTVDILNPKVVDKFIDLTHSEYKKRLGDKFKNLKGFFTDEPQYYRWAHPYTPMLEKAFKEKYSEDVLDGLGLMFIEKKGYEQFRYKYWKTMQELMLKNFSEKVYNWCSNNNVQLTGHYVEERDLAWQVLCCGGIMPFYEYMHIPGIDNLARSVPYSLVLRQISSVSAQLGKKKVITETFGCCGWDVTLLDLKIIAESQYVHGVNCMCEHLIPYSEVGQRKRDYPAHFSPVNPFVKKDFKKFNDYFARLGCLLGESDERLSVAVFNPVRSVYFDYKRYDFNAQNKYNDSYIILTEKLSKMNIPYHIIDETLLAKYGKVENSKLILGNCAYDFILFPEIITMDETSKKLLDKYYAEGGKMLFTGDIPSFVGGEKIEYNYTSNVTIEEIIDAQEYKVDNHQTKIRSCLREIDEQKFIYAVNTDFKQAQSIRFTGEFNSFIRFDLETLQTEKISTNITLDVGESALLLLSDEKIIPKETQKEQIKLNGKYNVIQNSPNFMLLDKMEFSTDGVNYSEQLSYVGVLNELLCKRYSGRLFLRFNFEVEKLPEKINFIAEEAKNISLCINGNEVKFTSRADVEEKLLISESIASKLKIGINEAVLSYDYYQSEQVYYVLFGENIDESLKNCLAYDSSVEPCLLMGEFGVYSKNGFVDGVTPNVYLADEFYISEKSSVIESGVLDGYPFFAGQLVLEGTFNAESQSAQLLLDANVNFISDIFINGKAVDKSYFAQKVDLINVVKKGENTIRMTVTVSNRNLMGPHHYIGEENPLFVGPGTFELPGTWKNGKSNLERSNYSFVKFGIFSK